VVHGWWPSCISFPIVYRVEVRSYVVVLTVIALLLSGPYVARRERDAGLQKSEEESGSHSMISSI